MAGLKYKIFKYSSIVGLALIHVYIYTSRVYIKNNEYIYRKNEESIEYNNDEIGH